MVRTHAWAESLFRGGGKGLVVKFRRDANTTDENGLGPHYPRTSCRGPCCEMPHTFQG